MGLVWSLKSAPGQPENMRMSISNTERPSIITIKVFNGHLDLEQIYNSENNHQSLAETQLERWFYFPDKVTRAEIECGNVRGTLFLPKGMYHTLRLFMPDFMKHFNFTFTLYFLK